MLCKISDLLVEIPAAGGMASRCREYLSNEENSADIIIRADSYEPKKWPHLSEDDNIYMQSCAQFYHRLLDFDGMMLHASAVELEGRAYLFSGHSGIGKSTHARLWQQLFGEAATVINDDKPALRRPEGQWYAYGTPWCGKDGINLNRKAPLAGICFLRRGEENKIHRLTEQQAMERIIAQTMHRLKDPRYMDLMLGLVDTLVREIPVYEFFNQPVPEAAQLSYETMRRGAEEMGL